MTALVWASLAVFLIALVGGLAFAGVRALAAWRRLTLFRGRAVAALGETTSRVAELERRLAATGETAARLDEARRQLQTGLSVAALLLGATGDTRAAVGLIRGLVPRK